MAKKETISDVHKIAAACLYQLGVHASSIAKMLGCNPHSVNRYRSSNATHPFVRALPQRPGLDTPEMYISVWKLYCDLYPEWLILLGDSRARPEDVPLSSQFNFSRDRLEILLKGLEEQLGLSTLVTEKEEDLRFILYWPTFLIDHRTSEFVSAESVVQAYVAFEATAAQSG